MGIFRCARWDMWRCICVCKWKSILKADKLMVRGHMTIFKNTPEVNKRFMADTGEKFNYKDIFSSEHFLILRK